ncbi:hypothetical protein GCM10025864_33940 [Luteimicrobium album]|uniref:Uncharacterized protein n=1 Tax=Luteimicrobium album TaxID=1054550 RepID=A0ABQ6I7A4_9MICO|nr:hypothetical protein GCM10025864_33940 [Luteimicrobium album]
MHLGRGERAGGLRRQEQPEAPRDAARGDGVELGVELGAAGAPVEGRPPPAVDVREVGSRSKSVPPSSGGG